MNIARLAALLMALLCTGAHAHRPSDAFLTLSVRDTHLEGQWEIALRDLDIAVGLDANSDGAITWGELHNAQGPLADALMRSLIVRADGMICTLKIADLLINDRLEGRFAWFALEGHCPQPATILEVDYNFLFEIDPSHRGILVVHADQQTHSGVLSPSQPTVALTLTSISHWRQFVSYLVEGVWHIWMGFDHILFLIVLLLPAVLARERGRWQSQPTFTAALGPIVGVVTAFTLAHSLALSLAAFDVLRLPSRWVESAIAASVLLAALNNLKPIVTRARWRVAFAFGLIHGFGFASALSELGLPRGSRLLSLLAFNLGVESGQLAIVVVAMPCAYLLRRTGFYRVVILHLGSAAVAVIAALWLWQRLTGT